MNHKFNHGDTLDAEEVARLVNKKPAVKIDEARLRFAVKYFSYIAKSPKFDPSELDLMAHKRIIDECSKEFGVSISNIKSTSRFAAAWDARHCAVMLMRVAGMSLNEIAASLGKKRPNVAYAIKAMRNRMETEPAFAARVVKIAKAAGVMVPFSW